MNSEPFPMPRARGRPRKPDSALLHPVTIRLTLADIVKLRALGGRKWVAARLAKVKP